ncbi:MAG: hypothetical protein KC593_19250 [Myxococcales bacterium]|nr:hypothetical protein [Myxococcales bacterium]
MSRRVLVAGALLVCGIVVLAAFEITSSQPGSHSLAADPEHASGDGSVSDRSASASGRAADAPYRSDAGVRQRSVEAARSPNTNDSTGEPSSGAPSEGAPSSSGRLILDPSTVGDFVPATPEQLAASRENNQPVTPTAEELANPPLEGYWGPTANEVTRACQEAARRVVAHGGEPWFRRIADGCDDESGLTKTELVELCEAIAAARSNAVIERLVRVNCNVGPPEQPGVI